MMKNMRIPRYKTVIPDSDVWSRKFGCFTPIRNVGHRNLQSDKRIEHIESKKPYITSDIPDSDVWSRRFGCFTPIRHVGHRKLQPDNLESVSGFKNPDADSRNDGATHDR